MKLVARVALASALAAALGGAVSAFSAGITAKGLVAEQEKSSLMGAARELAEEVRDELEEEEPDQDDDEEERAEWLALKRQGADARKRMAWALAHELEDVKLPGARAAVFVDGKPFVGDLKLVPTDECELEERVGTPLRSCAVRMGEMVLVLEARADAERDRRALFSSALWIGLLCGALLGGLLSYTLSRWALAPLTRLRDQVRAIPVDADAALTTPAPQPELEELRFAIASLVERLGAALRQAQSFAAEAAHELRTPLTTVAGELELLEESASDPAAIARVRRQVASLTELVQRLLVIAQPNRIAQAQMEVVDLSDVAEAALLALGQRARVSAHVKQDVIVRGDQALLRALLTNALENALKFSSGAVTLTISSDTEARIEVDDEGPGVAAEERERVFKPFYRSAAARAGGASGHGIGLALIARVAWVHGGRAEFVDRPRGARLRVSLPLWQTAT